MNIGKKKTGFTMIELLIVITIIGILAVAFLPSLLKAPARARDTQRKEDVKNIANYLTTLYVSTGNTLPGFDLKGTYPPGVSGFITTGPIIAGYPASLQGLEKNFGGKLPYDPKKKTYCPATQHCTGYYILNCPAYYPNSKIAFVVMAFVEIPQENGNYNYTNSVICKSTVTPSTNTPYFAVLVQK